MLINPLVGNNLALGIETEIKNLLSLAKERKLKNNFFDIEANHGLYIQKLQKQMKLERAYLFEPQKILFELLKKNFVIMLNL